MLVVTSLLVAATPQREQQTLSAAPDTHVAFLEVGCSDFNTVAQLTNLSGISVEPIPFYLNQLPDRPGLRKVNVAASNVSGASVDAYWTDPRAIEPTVNVSFLAEHGLNCSLPRWLRGCNQIGSMHPNIPYALHRCGGNLNDRGLVHVTAVPVQTVAQILDDQNVDSLDFVKVDTEGFDGRVVHSLLNAVEARPSRRPDHIKYESMHLQDEEIAKLENRLGLNGFMCSSDDVDTTCSSVNPPARTPLPWVLHRASANADAPEA